MPPFPADTPEEHPASPSSLDEAVSVFVELRPRLFGIAYRMLGSAGAAEDTVQEVWLRWQRTDRSAVASPAAFLSCATARIAINTVQSAWMRHLSAADPWPPELPDSGGTGDPEAHVQLIEELEAALLLVLAKLGPVERAVYILREAFGYEYPRIADIVRLSAVNVRKVASRARRRLQTGDHDAVDLAEHRRLREVFVSAARTGDVAALEMFLAPAPRSEAA